MTLSDIVAGAWRMADWQMGPQQRLGWIEDCLSLGITSATDPDVSPDQLQVYRAMDARGALHLRMNLLAGRRSGDGRSSSPSASRCTSSSASASRFFCSQYSRWNYWQSSASPFSRRYPSA